jgi:hypothetical protein
VVLEAVVLVRKGVQAGREEDDLRRKDGKLTLLSLGEPRLGRGPKAFTSVSFPPSPTAKKGGQ